MSDLERRVQRLEDRWELQELAIRYFRSADDDDYETMGTCFAADATFSAGGFPGGNSRQEVVDFIRADRESMDKTIHTFNSMLLQFQGDDEATGVIAAHLELGRGGTTLFAGVRYYDSFVRVDGMWQIKNTEMKTIHVGPWDDVATSLTEELSVRWPGADAGPSEVT
jgi:hypothetical protein